MKNWKYNQNIVESKKTIQEALPYNGTIEDYVWWDFSEEDLECYDISGNLIKDTKHEEWTASNCYLRNKSWQIIVKATKTKEALEWEVRVKSILYYYENWNITLETNYINWELNWEEIAYYGDWQTIKYKWNYLNWQKNWVWIRYDEKWQKRGIGNYLNWEQNGKRISFYENWQKERESYFKNWLPNWEFIKYYENWNIKERWNYKDWVLEWKIINYYENWQILWEAIFKHGDLIQEKFYDEN